MTRDGVEGSEHCDHAVAVETSKPEITKSYVCQGDFFKQ